MRLLLILLALSACAVPAPPGGVDVARNYALAYLDDEPFAPRATITFGPDGEVGGQAPCNRWSARLTEPLPTFAPDGITSTEMACDALPAEAIFFAALIEMTTAEITDQTVILRGGPDRSMVFRAQD